MNYAIPLDCQIINLNEIYLKYFGYKSDGFFVDVGAYDGVDKSNTWALAEAGWKGICYEPVILSYNLCVQAHLYHRVKSILTCIGNKKGTTDFYVAGVLSTYNENYYHSDYWHEDYKGAEKITSNIITLDESLEINLVKPEFDLLSLDVEGSETDVLNGFNINYWKPKMAIVEAQELHESHELTLQAPFINKYFKDGGYEKIYCDAINNIYIKN
jgi:FkbM family methyltransferase